MPKFGHGNGNWSKNKDLLYDRFIPFTVPDRSPFLTVTMTVPENNPKIV
jgi:hypothetical protein